VLRGLKSSGLDNWITPRAQEKPKDLQCVRWDDCPGSISPRRGTPYDQNSDIGPTLHSASVV
jgi:hypothetical protein